MLKKRIFGLFLLPLVAFFFPHATNTRLAAAAETTAPALPAADASDAVQPGKDQSALDLALKTISLSQGEGGVELWRLKAEWASIQKQEDRILLTQPRLTYFMKEDGKILYVQSDSGDVDQKNQILRFINNVRVTQEDKVLTGNILVYNGTAKTMTMFEGANLTADSMEGSSNVLVWHLTTKHIETSGDVVMYLETAGPDKNHLPQK